MEKDLISLVKDAGIVGAGGAGFPTHVKLNAKAEYVIVNGAECEPLLRVDQQLMAMESRKILEGLKLIKEHVGAKYAVIALKEKYKNPQANIKAEIDLMLQGEVTKNYPKEIKENLIKEKIRLLYVGITRAKEMLILSASAKNSAQDKRNQNPSMYLNILKNIIDNKGE